MRDPEPTGGTRPPGVRGGCWENGTPCAFSDHICNYDAVSGELCSCCGERNPAVVITAKDAEIAGLRAENVRLREYVRNAGDTFAGLTGEHGVAGLTYFREKKVWLGRMLDEASRALKGAEA